MPDALLRMNRSKRIALIAHDNRKADMLDWARYNLGTLTRHELFATGSTGALLERELGLKITRFLSGPLGGDQQVGAALAEGRIDFVIFFWDPLEPQPHDVVAYRHAEEPAKLPLELARGKPSPPGQIADCQRLAVMPQHVLHDRRKPSVFVGRLPRLVEGPQDSCDPRDFAMGVDERDFRAEIPARHSRVVGDKPRLVLKRLARPHHALILGHVLGGKRRGMKVVIVPAERLGRGTTAVEREPGRVHPHETAFAVLHEELDVGQRIEEREHLIGRGRRQGREAEWGRKACPPCEGCATTETAASRNACPTYRLRRWRERWGQSPLPTVELLAGGSVPGGTAAARREMAGVGNSRSGGRRCSSSVFL